ncbi:hypothetical protein LPJ73_002230 [Coemansia sp. RSA 2703]|nr:hypothetical protein LPJ73_002230 [Coemansia sp. RSA 2703]KAJ2377673.1 hypothetical protein IW150_001248 [Coemansia sp. RSA 2607]KAJ2394289.1 hypothetical protein GGI05_002105 [Coemansia sp. RSA 2603]
MSTRDIHVVIVGMSVAGTAVARTVAALSLQGYPNLRVTMVDKNEFYYHVLGAPRAVVEKGFGKKLLWPIHNYLENYEVDKANPKHKFIQASLKAVNSDKTIELSDGQVLAFDYLVLSTGSTNKTPSHFTGTTYEAIEKQMDDVYENVKEAKEILIIGGGAVGVEVAGEIAHAYKDKKITLVHSAERLLPLNFKAGLSNGAVDKLQRLGVRVVLNEKIELPQGVEFNCKIRPLELKGSSGATYKSDLQILTTGATVNAQYIETLERQFGDTLRTERGTIKVRSTLQLASDKMPTVFVPGDVNSLPAGTKFAMKVGEQAETVGKNIVTMIKANYDQVQREVPQLSDYKGGDMAMILVPIGKELGVFQGFNIAFGKSFVGNFMSSKLKAKDYFVSKFSPNFPAPAPAK